MYKLLIIVIFMNIVIDIFVQYWRITESILIIHVDIHIDIIKVIIVIIVIIVITVIMIGIVTRVTDPCWSHIILR